jgi:hypothetical protein
MTTLFNFDDYGVFLDYQVVILRVPGINSSIITYSVLQRMISPNPAGKVLRHQIKSYSGITGSHTLLRKLVDFSRYKRHFTVWYLTTSLTGKRSLPTVSLAR